MGYCERGCGRFRVTCQHVNFHCEYDVSDKVLQGGVVFNLEELLELNFDWFYAENGTEISLHQNDMQ